MQLAELILPEGICLDLKSRTKNEVFSEIVSILVKKKLLKNKVAVLKSIKQREKQMSTGIGTGVAIPHAKCDVAEEFVIAFARAEEGIDYQALDDEPVNLIFLLVTPPAKAGDYLKALGKISRLVKNRTFRNALLSARSAAAVQKAIKEAERLV